MEEKNIINETVDETIEETVTEPAIEDDEVEGSEPPAEPVYGTVTGCGKLNIRTKPVVNPSNVVTIVDSGTMLLIDPEDETGEWYKVFAPNNIEGFCMKKFVTID